VYCYVIIYPILFFNLTNLANSVGALCMDITSKKVMKPNKTLVLPIKIYSCV
jgi:hypothetical protein